MSGGARVGRLHVLIGGPGALELARLAADGGADTLQLRDKRPLALEALVAVARPVHELLRARGVALIIDDRIDLAAALGASGVHLGARDAPPRAARAALGTAAIVGRTANGYDEALRVAREPVDYLGVGPVFATGSKRDPAPVLGLAGLRRIVAAVDKPVIAIGGIDAGRVAGVLDCGAHGVAVLSAVAAAADPRREVARMREALERAGGGCAEVARRAPLG